MLSITRLNQRSSEVKNHLAVYKVKRFKPSSSKLLQCSFFHNLLRTSADLQVLLDIVLLTWGASEDYEIVVKTLNSGYSIWMFFVCLFVCFRSGHFHNVVSTFTNVVKLDVENGNIVSTSFNIVHVNVEIRNVDSTLLDVANFNVEIHKVVSTLIWRCPRSRRPSNQKTTSKQRWNVCWVRPTIYCTITWEFQRTTLKAKEHI